MKRARTTASVASVNAPLASLTLTTATRTQSASPGASPIEPRSLSGSSARVRAATQRANFLRKLIDPQFGQPTFLFTTDPGRYEFQPKVTQPLADQAARCVGFVEQATLTLPDHRQARLYERATPIPAPLTNQTETELAARCSP